ncbi:hypothetical protein BSP109_03284 [Brevibacterium sp. Mu109]|uniref:hypothetical protein n=1 Tax=Brevibacterium sp. Mu109 TaxID=1255669 RepID=UPI000C690142|nr:hypothetical protein [Brevibacterium sp. Mu109]SMY01472.1 hypothetical protein BSP109_03284 [Brevibacterium sp. Mu109]
MTTKTTATTALVLSAAMILTACTSGSSEGPAAEDTPESTFDDQPSEDDLDQLGEGPRDQADIDASDIQDMNPVRDSASYDYLETPNMIEPGARYVTIGSDGQMGNCSFGWIVRERTAPDTTYNLTAGHCGNPGDAVAIDPVGNDDPADMFQVGEFVWQQFTPSEDGGISETEPLDDYALIEFYPEYAVPELMTGTPNFALHGAQDELTLGGYCDAALFEDNVPMVGRIGYRNGLSIGPFQEMRDSNVVTFSGIADQGDSGGAIWAFDPNDDPSFICAVAVTSYIDFEDATVATGVTVDKVMEQLDLEILA